MLAVTLVARPPGGSVPPVTETSTHAPVVPSAHVKELLPKFARAKSWEVRLKGPPTEPLETKPDRGAMSRLSGRAKLSYTPAVVLLSGEVAVKPMPRLAKAAHSSLRFAPSL